MRQAVLVLRTDWMGGQSLLTGASKGGSYIAGIGAAQSCIAKENKQTKKNKPQCGKKTELKSIEVVRILVSLKITEIKNIHSS